MRILVTGGNGFVGRSFIKRAMNSAHFIRVCDKDLNWITNNTDKLEILSGDLNDYDFCLKLVQGIDVVCHFAGSGHGQIYSKERIQNINLECFNNNVTSAVNLFNACVDSKHVKKVIQMSSAAVYEDSSEPKTEEAIPRPSSVYAISKLCQEYYADLFRSMFGLNIISLRCFNIYGVNDSVDPIKSNIVHRYIHLMKDSKRPLIIGNPYFTRDYVYIEDVVEIVLKVIKSDTLNNEVINVGTGVSTTLNQLIELINKELNKEIVPILRERSNFNIANSVASVDKCLKKIDFQCCTSLENGVRSMIDEIC